MAAWHLHSVFSLAAQRTDLQRPFQLKQQGLAYLTDGWQALRAAWQPKLRPLCRAGPGRLQAAPL